MEKDDPDLYATALRECQEEIGIEPSRVELLGRLSEVYIPLSNFNITPFVGTVTDISSFSLSRNEVAEVYLAPLPLLFDDTKKTSCTFYRHDYPIVASGYQLEDHFVWGATAMILSELEMLLRENMFQGE